MCAIIRLWYLYHASGLAKSSITGTINRAPIWDIRYVAMAPLFLNPIKTLSITIIGPVSAHIHLHNGYTGFRVARHNASLNGCRPAPAWRSDVDIDASMFWGIQN